MRDVAAGVQCDTIRRAFDFADGGLLPPDSEDRSSAAFAADMFEEGKALNGFTVGKIDLRQVTLEDGKGTQIQLAIEGKIQIQ